MKKILICFVALLAAVSASAQEHLSFKGIPLEGSVLSFCQKLKAKGFTQIAKESNSTFLKGNFTGRDAVVCVSATDDGKNVFSVGVIFDPSGEWNTLTSTYEHYKALYTRKYGEPSFNKEYNPATHDSNSALMYEVHQGTVVYGSAWNVSGGEIELKISKSTGFYEGMVVIVYRDAQNIEEKQNKDLEDI